VKRILITHAHADHVGGLPKLKAATEAEVIASAGERPVIEGEIPVPRADPATLPPLARLMNIGSAPRFTRVPVDRVVNGDDEIPEVMSGLRVIPTPGHAPGHISFWQPDRRILFLGDVIMRFPNVRLPFAAATPDMAENKRSLRRVCAFDVDILCLGHGTPITRNGADYLRAFARKVGVL
jgi:glyoxylase-like metal-dependent hydrolase (beta-lactamase superfamily II)